MKESDYNPAETDFLISRLVDDDLEEALRPQVQEKLDRNPADRATFAAYRRLDQQLRALPTELDMDWDLFTAHVHKECAKEQNRRTYLRIFQGVGALAAAAALVVMVTVVSLRKQTDGSGVQPLVVAQIQVGPSSNRAMSEMALAAKSEFRFGRGREITTVVAPEPRYSPPSETLLVAAVQPLWSGSGRVSADEAPF